MFLFIFFLILSSQIFLSSSYSAIEDKNYDSLNPPVNVTDSNFVSYFAICAVVKNELDIREWVTYHYRMGCGKFYIHDNGDIPVAPQIRDFIRRGIVDVVHIANETAPQLLRYRLCIRNYRTFHRFIGFIDGDEYIVTKNGCSIPSVLKRYEPYGGLTLNWMVFGSSGHLKKPPNGVIRNYWSCYQYQHVKSIVNTDYAVSHLGNPHIFLYSHGKYAVDTDFFKVQSPFNPPRQSLYEIMYMNHYHLKSKEEYDRNRLRGRASTTKPTHKNEEYFLTINSFCNRNCSILEMPKVAAKECHSDVFTNTPLSPERMIR